MVMFAKKVLWRGRRGRLSCFAAVAVVAGWLLASTLPALAGALPDTGQTKFYDNDKEIPCPPAKGEPFYGQDAHYTRPRSYTKLDAHDNELPDSAAIWYQVRDNVTGLIWEVKQDRDDKPNYANPHDADNSYTWYDSNPATNGGDAGIPGDGTDTEDFIVALNSENGGSGYCGHTDWRLPTPKELSGIVDRGRVWPAVDTEYFPQVLSSYHWSSTTDVINTDFAWRVGFDYGIVSGDHKSSSFYVRAVRLGQ